MRSWALRNVILGTDPSISERAKWNGPSMPVCNCEARPGGKIPYEWSDGKGGGFYQTGEFIVLEPFSRIVHVERMY
ncbi:hypothetical protein [Sphingorhabdus sp.]|uniref:hypothetical protein n=1 Tax=Sphingorhabdus sp. TaxID=1902408 RepID=UPI0032B7EFA5